MKWVGQHIWDFISRFRSDVYLEDLSTTTETNVLVVDSDGKISKNTTTLGGDITSVAITTDSGGGAARAIDSSDEASFSILGANGVGVTNSGTTITATAVPGEIDHDSLLNFVAAEHYNWSTDIASTATIHTENITDLHGAGVDGADGNVLTDKGDGSIDSEANLTFGSSTLTIGAADNSTANEFRRLEAGTDIVGGDLKIQAGNARSGVGNNRAGGALKLYGGSCTGTGDSGNIEFYQNYPTVSGSAQITANLTASFAKTASTNRFVMYEPVAATDLFGITVEQHGASTISTTDGGGSNAPISINPDGYLSMTSSTNKINTTYDFTSGTEFEGDYNVDDTSGTIIKYSPGSDDTLAGSTLYFLHTDGTWTLTDGTNITKGASQLLGVGMGNARSAGVLIKGFVRLSNDEILNIPGSGAVDGLPIYVSSGGAGHFDFNPPSGSTHFVRIVGYAIDGHDEDGDSDDSIFMYFDPDKTWIERA